MIYSYQKHIDSIRTVEAIFPTDDKNQRKGTELATVEGITYINIPEDTDLPGQPAEIDVVPAVITDDLLASIKQASPHYRLINEQVSERIRQRYSIDDEIKLLRIAPSDETTAWNDYVEECRLWGRDQKALLGL